MEEYPILYSWIDYDGWRIYLCDGSLIAINEGKRVIKIEKDKKLIDKLIKLHDIEVKEYEKYREKTRYIIERIDNIIKEFINKEGEESDN